MRAARTIVAGVVIAGLFATGCTWHFETLDGNGGSNGRTTDTVGTYNATILYNGGPHVFYYDATDNALRHAYWNGSFWAFETLDGNGGPGGRTTNDVGLYNAAILYNSRPHVFYQDQTDGNLRHTYWNGVAWAFETLDGAGGAGGRINSILGSNTSVVLYNGRPHVFYLDESDGNLRHAYYNGVAWAFETLDGAGGPNGRVDDYAGEASSVIIYNSRPHVFYHSDTGGAAGLLRHAYWNGVAWAFETLDGAGGPDGRGAREQRIRQRSGHLLHTATRLLPQRHDHHAPARVLQRSRLGLRDTRRRRRIQRTDRGQRRQLQHRGRRQFEDPRVQQRRGQQRAP